MALLSHENTRSRKIVVTMCDKRPAGRLPAPRAVAAMDAHIEGLSQ